MSSKTSHQQQQQPQQQPMSWRAAAKQQKDKSSQPQQQQQQQPQNVRANGFKQEGKDKNAKQGGGAPSTPRMTPSSATTTPVARPATASAPKGFLNEGAAGRLDAAAFDAANNMMPNFARNQRQYQQQPQQPNQRPQQQQQQRPKQQQQQQQRPQSPSSALYVQRNSMERIEGKNKNEPQKSFENEKRTKSQSANDEEEKARKPTTNDDSRDDGDERSGSVDRERKTSDGEREEGKRTNEAAERTPDCERPSLGSTPSLIADDAAAEQMGKHAANRRAATPRNETPTPPPSKDSTPEVTQGEETKALATPEDVIKHPLKNKWAMWYFKNDKTKDWKENQRYVVSFDTIEDFWALYNHLVPPSELQSGCDYSLFKEGVEPMWEDPKNVDGGRWLINSLKQQRQAVLDRIWMETLLCLVGEAFEDASDEVCGTVVNVRPKGDKLAIWTRNAEDQVNNLSVGRGLRDRLGLPKQIQLGFQVHKDTMTKYGSVTRNKYVA